MNGFTKTIVNGLKSYVQNNIKKARSNWNQNDETAVDYVRNRTHWIETKFVDVIPETTLYSSSGRTRDAAGPSLTMFYVTSEHISEIPNFTVGEEYTVIWNGTEYKCKAKMVSEVACLGNESIAGGIKNTGEPFFIMPDTFDFYREESSDDVLCMIGTTESITEVTIKVSGLVTTVHKIDAKYLPEIKNIKNLVDGESIGSIRTIGTNTEIGEYAFAEGLRTNASGSTSHAEGESTEASGISSHAEGYDTTASGNYSHAEGYGTNASGAYSHAEGHASVATRDYAHAEGLWGKAEGVSSHAEGYYTKASGYYSHAEGESTTAYGKGSHAEGLGGSKTLTITGDANAITYTVKTWDIDIKVGSYLTYGGNISKINSFSKTNLTITLDKSLSTSALSNTTVFFIHGIAGGDYSHAEGYRTTASGEGSHAEGLKTNASGAYSHAEGYLSIASGERSHAEGYETVALGNSAHAEGYGVGIDLTLTGAANTTTYTVEKWYSYEIQVGKYIKYNNIYAKIKSFSETNLTVTLDKTLSSVALSNSTVYITGIAGGDYSHAEGECTTASGDSSHAEGLRTTASGDSSHAEGDLSIASGSCSHAEGYYTKASGNDSHAEGDRTTASGDSSHAEGHLTDATGNFSHAEGITTTASGSKSHAEGNGTTASGDSSHAEGEGTTASGSDSHAEGRKTVASGEGSHAEGDRTTASGNYSHAEGDYTTASGNYSHAEGQGTKANTKYMNVFGTYNTGCDDIYYNREAEYSEYKDFYDNKTYYVLSDHPVEFTIEGKYDITDITVTETLGINLKEGDLVSSLANDFNDYYKIKFTNSTFTNGKKWFTTKYAVTSIKSIKGKYVHIVGNGDSEENRSNAHTLDWQGNAWFAGDIYVGGTGQDDTDAFKVITEKEINLPKDYFALNDIENGYTYIIQMKNGNLISRCSLSRIEVTTIPNKTEYYSGEHFNSTGMIVTGICQDNSTFEITNYTLSNNANKLTVDDNEVTISYTEVGITHTATVNISVAEFDVATILVDFTYTTNDDGTYTITGWKETLNGEPSTEMVVPDISLIKL